MRKYTITDTVPHAFDRLVLPCDKEVCVGDFVHVTYDIFVYGDDERRETTGFVTGIIEDDGYCECGEEHRLVDIKLMSLDGETYTIASAHIIDVDSVKYEASDAVMSVVASAISSEKKHADARAALVSVERKLRALPDSVVLVGDTCC